MKPEALEYHLSPGQFIIMLADGGFKAPEGYTFTMVFLESAWVVLRFKLKHA